MLAEVRSGAFDPDATRSGQVRAPARAPSEDEEEEEGVTAVAAVAAAAVVEPAPPDAMRGAWDALMRPPWSTVEAAGSEAADGSEEEVAGSRPPPPP